MGFKLLFPKMGSVDSRKSSLLFTMGTVVQVLDITVSLSPHLLARPSQDGVHTGTI